MRLRWFGRVMRRDEGSRERQIMEMEGRRRQGQPKTRLKDCVVIDRKEKNVDLGTVEDKQSWKRLIKHSDPL